MTDVVVEKKGHVAIVKIEHMQAMNALSTDMYAQLEEAFNEVAKMDDAYCVVLTGSSTVNKKGKTVNSFVAGADIAQMSTMTVEEGKFFGNDSNRVCWMIENFKRPVIAAINGFCLGGGCELAMACDIRLASDNAVFGQPEVGLGITPGCGGTQRLARIVGLGKAKEMLYTARGNYSAQDALDMGLVNYVYPLDQLMDEALKLAEEIAAQAPIAVSLVKEAVNVGMQTDLNSALKFEGNVFGQCFATEDQKYGMAWFLDKNRDKPAKEFKNK
ncbi:enoyl-CoA hydratase-related protein [Agathobaculum sp.]|uniref:enoyl-CoA hydratase-related protein n=1 Tax=Agathobaculum sp. TaxID=2048138 RepID=UPI002A7FD793|nr:enoyl-CoA hydratase-related protein [Agathobaculum sp.]MDY3619108.1 enoyl-CoA hydratase-related protein [Agathobaculum sp.]